MLLLASVSAFAQTTGNLTGTVTSDGAPLPGALVTASSPQLQGTRTAYTDVNGNYNMAALPPGDYVVRISLEGLQDVTRSVRVTLSGIARADADLRVSAVTGAITVTAAAPAVLEATEIVANYSKQTVDDLPLTRTVTGIALLAPGTTSNGPRGALQISGSFANDNLIMVNGANIQENLRGQARPLFIEDAIQETTVITGSVSAEFGRFTGGVVSSITKSGGNQFSGSFRDTIDNPSWTSQSAFGESRANLADKINNTYEATLGGRIIRDRLWFFGAGRLAETSATGAPVHLTGETITSVTENTRYEVKLTGQITDKHSLVGNYLDNPLDASNNNQLGVYETRALDPSITQAEDFKAAHYSGIFTNNLLGEVHYSERAFTFVGFGGENSDPYLGTPLFLASTTGAQGVANAPYFCGVCDDELRNNELLTAKLTYFLGTKALGTHNIVGGVERFGETRLSNNYQSPTNLVVELYGSGHKVNLVGGQPVFTINGDGNGVVAYYPVEIPSIGSDLTTDSFFINDKWDFNKNFSFNLGARYDTTDAQDQEGNPTANDSAISPRLGVIYDVQGNGRVRINASFANYVGRLAEGVQGQGSGAGSPAGYYYYYDGPSVSGSSATVVKTALDWFFANGGTNLALNPPHNASIGGVNVQILDGDLKAPSVDEWTIGAGFQLGPNGFIRADYIDREWKDQYVAFTNRETGQVNEPRTDTDFDLTLIGNSDLLVRTYEAVQMQGQYRLFNRLNLGGNYTWSKLRGNAEGENTGNGPISEGGWIFQYPEYQGYDRNRPEGYLSGDQRHKLRLWAAMDFALGPVGRLNVSVLQRYDSGTPFQITATVPRQLDPGYTGPALTYVSPPQNTTVFLEGRGDRRWDDVTPPTLR
jgi:outer membrane receptor protein involved in Fe transport